MRFVIAAMLLLWIPAVSAAEFEYEFNEGIIVFSYDQSRISSADLKRYLVVHPVVYNTDYHIPPNLGLCVDDSSLYFECGSRDFYAVNFYENAKINIDIGKQRIETLSKLTKFPELQKLVNYFKSSLEFGVWQNERLLEYYTHWDVGALNQPYKNFKHTDEVATILDKIRSSKDRDSKWRISYYEWSNAVNQIYREHEGEVPQDGWEKFKSKYQIKEEIQFNEVY